MTKTKRPNVAANRVVKLVAAVLVTAAIALLAVGLMTDYAMRVAGSNQLVAQNRVLEEWPGFEVRGGTNTPVGPTRSRHLVYGLLNGATVEVELVVVGRTAEIIMLRPHAPSRP